MCSPLPSLPRLPAWGVKDLSSHAPAGGRLELESPHLPQQMKWSKVRGQWGRGHHTWGVALLPLDED